MTETKPVDLQKEIPDVLSALMAAQKVISGQGIEPKLKHLVVMRASQINGCAYCVKMHTHEARRDGETNERLDRLIVWEHVDDFDAREKAAFGWTEALTYLAKGTDYGAHRERLRLHFSEKEIAALTALIGMINLWNRLQVSNH